MDNAESDGKKFQIRATQEDQSRLKSLEFLLLAVGRQITSEQLKNKKTQDVQKIRDDLKTLKVTDDGENWTITTTDSKVSANKNLFSFYRRDSSTVSPVQNNNASNAFKVLQELLNLQIESSPALRNEKYLSLSQPQFMHRLQSYFLLILCFLSEFVNSMPVNNFLTVNWLFYIVFFLLAGFLKRKQNLVLFGFSTLGSILILIMITLNSPKIAISFLNPTSIYISTILLVALDLNLSRREYREISKNILHRKPLLIQLFCLIGVFYLAVRNSALILNEFVEILSILVPFVFAILFKTAKNRVLKNLLLLTPLLFATYFFLFRIQFESLGQIIFYSLILISSQFYEFFHGTRLNYMSFLSRNAILIAGVIV